MRATIDRADGQFNNGAERHGPHFYHLRGKPPPALASLHHPNSVFLIVRPRSTLQMIRAERGITDADTNAMAAIETLRTL